MILSNFDKVHNFESYFTKSNSENIVHNLRKKEKYKNKII